MCAAIPGPAANHAKTPAQRPLGISLRAFSIIPAVIPVGNPFPNIARHIHDAIRRNALGLAPHRPCPVLPAAIFPIIQDGMPASRFLVPPGIFYAPPPPGSFLPFSFSRQSLPCPVAIGIRIMPVYTNDRMVIPFEHTPDQPQHLEKFCLRHFPARTHLSY